MSEISDLLERFRRGPELLAMALTGVFGEEEDFVTAPGKWSIRQIVAHLADTELVYAHRMRQMVAEENPTLIAFDQDAWTKNLDYARRKPKQCSRTQHPAGFNSLLRFRTKRSQSRSFELYVSKCR